MKSVCSVFVFVTMLGLVVFFGCNSESPTIVSSKEKINERVEPAQPNVLLVSIDTTRADHLGCYGYKGIQTPNIDALAQEGVLFEEAFSVQPVTLPAHASILTGKYPFRHGVRDNNIYELSKENETLAEVLQSNGYVTTAFVATYVLNHRFGLSQGFRYYNDKFVKPKQKGRLPIDRRASEVSFLATEWLKELDNELKTKPFFLWLHYYDPHADYNPPHPYKTAYGNPYDGEIAYMDDWLGYFFDELKKKGKWDNTIVVLVGDHGEGFGDHGEKTHGMFIYRATTHVPMMIKFPGAKHAQTKIAQRVSQVDIFPTILAELGFSHKDTIDGKALHPLLMGKEMGSRDVYSEVYIPRSFNWSELKGIRAGKDFYVSGPIPELYDIASDPQETQNRIDKEPAVAKRLDTQLTDWIQSASVVNANSVVLSDEMAQRLEQLGYFIGTDKPFEETTESLPDPKERISFFNEQQAANHLAEKGMIDEAIVKYEQIVDKDKTNPRFVLELASLYSKQQRFVEAEKRYLQALELDDANSRTHSLIGQMYQKWQRPKKAIQFYQRALAANPKDYISLFQLAVVELSMNSYDSAKLHFSQAVALRPDAAAYNNLGYISIKVDGQFKVGVRYIKKAIKLAHNKAPFLESLGMAYAEHGHSKKAIEYLEQALLLAPDNLSYIAALEAVYSKLGDSQGLKKLDAKKALLQQ